MAEKSPLEETVQTVDSGHHAASSSDSDLVYGTTIGSAAEPESTVPDYGEQLAREAQNEVEEVYPHLSMDVTPSLLLPARQVTLDCGGGCDFATESGKAAETLYLYDGSPVYDAQPTDGILTGQRAWVTGGDYSQVSYGYDGYGNLASQSVYTGFAAFSSSPASGEQTTTTTYDETYHTYALATTNALDQTTQTGYNYDVGQPTLVTDANSYHRPRIGRSSFVLLRWEWHDGQISDRRGGDVLRQPGLPGKERRHEREHP